MTGILHRLKSHPPEVYQVRAGHKRFEVRKDDRDPKYSEGDRVLFAEWVPDEDSAAGGRYTGEFLGPFVLTYVERSPCLPVGWCGFSFEPVEVTTAPMRSSTHAEPGAAR